MHTHKILKLNPILLNNRALDAGVNRAAITFAMIAVVTVARTAAGSEDQSGHNQQGKERSFVFHKKVVWIKTA
jgi:hypothetical protein